MGVGSFVEEYSNKVQLVGLNVETSEFEVRATLDHPYPATRVQFAPDNCPRNLFATAGDYLRLWSMEEEGGKTTVKQEVMFNSNQTVRFSLPPPFFFSPFPSAKPPGPAPLSPTSCTLAIQAQTKGEVYCAPVTSFDWNWADPSILATSSVDTTCTIWDANTKKMRTQLIAHDKEVFDIAWSRNKDIFATAGADGSLRLFDLRSLEHSTIMYEAPPGTPLLRLAWNRLNNFYVAAVAGDSVRAVIIDVRMPTTPVAMLPGSTSHTGQSSGHNANISTVSWAPHSVSHLVTGGDDSQALIWDLSCLPKPVEDPILAYTAEAEVNCLAWSGCTSDWVTISFGSKVQFLRV